VPIVLKSGSLNLLEPSGPVQACNGIALPLPYLFCILHAEVHVASMQTKFLPKLPAPHERLSRPGIVIINHF